jgi:hypothetical protein
MRAAAEAVFSPRGVHVETAEGVAHALELAMSITGPADAVLVTGSITTVGAAREHLQPSDEMRAEADEADGGSGMRTLLVGIADLEDDGGAEEHDPSGQDGYGDDDGEEGLVLD